jgi:hypothetical protein
MYVILNVIKQCYVLSFYVGNIEIKYEKQTQSIKNSLQDFYIQYYKRVEGPRLTNFFQCNMSAMQDKQNTFHTLISLV